MLAQLFDCDKRTIQNLANEGIVVKASRGKYVLGLSIRNYVRHLREIAAGRTGGDADINAVTEGALLKRAQRENYELKNAILAGQAIEVDKIAPAWARVIRAVRAGVLALPGKIRFAVPHLTAHDQEEIKRLCLDALDAAAVTDAPPAVEGADPDDDE